MAAKGDHQYGKTTKKVWVVALLAISCLTAFVLNLKLVPAEPQKLTDQTQIDSLISVTIQELNIPPEQLRIQTIEHDSLFKRQNYHIKVRPGFSKTGFHYQLHQHLYPYDVETYGEVFFPERDIRLHLLFNDTIHRSIFLETDPDLIASPRDVTGN